MQRPCLRAAKDDGNHRAAELAAKGEDFYSGLINPFDGQRVTRLEMLQSSRSTSFDAPVARFVYLRLKASFRPLLNGGRRAKER